MQNFDGICIGNGDGRPCPARQKDDLGRGHERFGCFAADSARALGVGNVAPRMDYGHAYFNVRCDRYSGSEKYAWISQSLPAAAKSHRSLACPDIKNVVWDSLVVCAQGVM